jgi:hypothetical protein
VKILILFIGLAIIVGMATGHIPLFTGIVAGAIITALLLGMMDSKDL